jgi:tripartite-type tricarboxylate transporter receptor subunit TctC
MPVDEGGSPMRCCPFALILAGTATAFATVFALADAVNADAFYAGKRLTVLVNYAPGGPTDMEARALARHIGRHIPGHPTVIVQNMGGAGGIVGTKYLGEIAPKDGTMVGYLSGAPQRFVSNPERFKVDFRDYEFIGYLPSGRIHFARADIKPGLAAPGDIVKATDVVVGGLGPDGPKDLTMRLTLDMLGVPHKYVSGYNSSARALLAFERGEINYYADSPPTYLSKIVPMVAGKTALAVYCDPIFDGNSFQVPGPMRQLAIPTFLDVYKRAKGAMPSGEKWDAYVSILAVSGTMYRVIAMPPGVPKPAVAALRQALADVQKDKAFVEEATKVMGDAPDYVSGPEVNDLVRNGLSVAPATKRFLAAYGQAIAKTPARGEATKTDGKK